MLGDATTFRLSQERQDIVTLLASSPEPMSPKHISEALGKKDGAVRKLLYSMSRAGTINGLGGAYTLSSGNTGNALDEVPATMGKSATPSVTAGQDRPVTLEPPQGRENPEPVTGVTTVTGVRVSGEAGRDRWTA